MTTLLPCPFCGGEPEIDYRRHYRTLMQGTLDVAAAIYCVDCGADMSMPRADTPQLNDDERLADLSENWNKRALPTKDMIHSAIVCVLVDTQEVRDIGTLTEKLMAALTEPQTALVDPGSSAPPVGMPQPPLVLTREG